MKFGAAIPVANEWRFIPAVVGQLRKVCERVVIMRARRSLSGQPLNLEPVPDYVKGSGVEILEDERWDGETEIRNAGMRVLFDCDYVFTVDSDEIFASDALKLLMRAASFDKPRAISCRMRTYWKTIDYQIDPPEDLGALVLVRQDVRFSDRRSVDGPQANASMRLMHHLSYVRTNEEVKEKLRLFGHASEVVPGWYDKVWKAWDENPALENLHPTKPEAFKRAIKVQSPIANVLAEHGVK